MAQKSRISTCLWFNTEAEDAARFYVSLVPNSRITGLSRYDEGAPMPEGTVLTVTFELDGVPFMALNGGPIFPQTEAASVVVYCDTQAEIDRLWNALTADGGKETRCGWLKDKYGVSWQIVYARVMEMIEDSDRAKVNRLLAAVREMVKLDVAKLEAAYKGE